MTRLQYASASKVVLAPATIAACADFAAPSFSFVAAMADIQLIWFGILVVVVFETEMISQPVGSNGFVVKSIARGVLMGQRFNGN